MFDNSNYSDIPKSVTLQNITLQPQRLEFGYTVPAGTTDANGQFTAGELTVDMSTMRSHLREKFWTCCKNAHGGLSIRIKSS